MCYGQFWGGILGSFGQKFGQFCFSFTYCMKESLAMNSNCVGTNSVHTSIAAWLDASQRSRDGVQSGSKV